jgi:hypothetical protein
MKIAKVIVQVSVIGGFAVQAGSITGALIFAAIGLGIGLVG